MKPLALIILLLTPVFALCALCFHKATAVQASGLSVPVATLIPVSFDGWKSEDLALGATEAESASALELLDLDDYVQRRYTKNGGSITVYIAYWKPGKTDTRLIATHNPDICWTGCGARCVESVHREGVDVNGLTTRPAEYRVFDMGHKNVRVFFWLLENGTDYNYTSSGGPIPNPVDFFTRFWQTVLAGKPEHYFIRISSELPKDRILSSSLLYEVLHDLENTGISVSQ